MQWAAGSHGYPTQTHWEQWRICLTEQMIKVDLKFFRYEQPVYANRYHKSVFNHQTYFILAFFLIYVDWKFFCPTQLFLAHCITLLSKLWFSWKLGLTVADLWIGSSLLCQVFFSLTSDTSSNVPAFWGRSEPNSASIVSILFDLLHWPSLCLPSLSNFTEGG